jgi:beta-lactamase regulating signal transducer with metallopeptidase domain
MTGHDVPILWCAVQTAIVALVGLFAAWVTARKAPAVAATATASAAATILLVTLLIPVRLPSGLHWFAAPTVSSTGDRPQHLPHTETAAAGEVSNPSLDIGALATRVFDALRAGGQAIQTSARHGESWLVGIALAGALIGLARLARSLRYAMRLRRSSASIHCDRTRQLFYEMKQRLGVRRTVDLCESSGVASPAVIGWWRPVVLLPVDRAAWTVEQLRAALAHELAHVVRNDFLWRVAATCAQSIHFFHPLVHLLTRRLVLVQELATDRLAAAAMGEKSHYLRALSELAIRLDDQERFCAEPIVVPAFSSHLIRRIAMLRSKEGSLAGGRRSAAGIVTALLIAVVGIGTLGLRGSAETTTVASSNASESPTEPPMFVRPAIDPSLMGESDNGLFVVRLGEMSERPVFVPVFQLAARMMGQRWREAFGADAPSFNFDSIEYLAGVPNLVVEPYKNEKDPSVSSRMMIGCMDFVVRFRHEVAWKAWIKEHLPGAEDIRENGFSYTRLPVIEAIGPVPLCVAARDARTLVCSTSVEHLQTLAASDQRQRNTKTAAQWNALEGGLATFLVTNSRIDPNATNPKDPGAQFARMIFENATQYAFGFDLDAASNQSAIRVDLKCKDAASAQRIQAAVAAMLPLAKAELQKMVDERPELVLDGAEREKWNLTAGGPDTDVKVGKFWMDVLVSCSTETIALKDGEVHVRITTKAPFPDQIMKAYEIAEKPDGVEGAKR